jgi:hypothetical protein
MLLTGSGDEFCGLLLALFQGVAYLLPAVGLPAFPAVCLLIVCMEISSLLLPTSPMHFQHSSPFCCVLIYSSLVIVQVSFFFFCIGLGGVLVCPRGLCWFIPGVAGGILHGTWQSPVWFAECLPSIIGAGRGGSTPVFSV